MKQTFKIIIMEFSSETMEVKRRYNNIFLSVKGKKSCQTKILYSTTISFRNKGKIKTSRKPKESKKRNLLYLVSRDRLHDIISINNNHFFYILEKE